MQYNEHDTQIYGRRAQKIIDQSLTAITLGAIHVPRD